LSSLTLLEKVVETPPPTETGSTTEEKPVKIKKEPKEPKPKVDENVMPAWFKKHITEKQLK